MEPHFELQTVNYPAALKRCQGRAQLVEKLCLLLAGELREYLEVLLRAAESNDANEIGNMAHKIKGAARTINAEPLAEIMEALEREARLSEPFILKQLVSDAQTRCEEFTREVYGVFGDPPPKSA